MVIFLVFYLEHGFILYLRHEITARLSIDKCMHVTRKSHMSLYHLKEAIALDLLINTCLMVD